MTGVTTQHSEHPSVGEDGKPATSAERILSTALDLFAVRGYDATAVRAGSNTMNGHFTLDGFRAARDWFEADVGVSYMLSDQAALSLSYRARLQDDTQDLGSVNFGLRMAF